MSNLLLLGTALLAGILLRQTGRVAEGGHGAFNSYIVHVALPAITLRTLHGFSFERDQFWPVLMPWVLFAIGALTFAGLGRLLGLARTSVGALTLVGGLGNTSFVGLPMIEALHGRDGIGLGMVIDQLGSYLALSTVGVFATAVYGADARATLGSTLRRIVTFPPFVAMVVSLLLRPVPLPDPVDKVLMRLGDTLAPVALVSVGLQLRFASVRQHLRALGLGLGYKLLVCPALVVGVMLLMRPAFDATNDVALIEASMPPMIGAGIVAAQARLDAPLVSMLIGIGIPLGLATAVAWHGVVLRLFG